MNPGDLVKYVPVGMKYVPFGIEKRPLALALVIGRARQQGVIEIMWLRNPYTENFGDIGWVGEKELELVARAGEEE